MLPITNLKYQQSWAKPLDDFDMEMETAEIEELDTIARKNLETTFCVVPKSMVRHPIIEYIYWKQDRTTIPHVPHDLQLEWYFKNFIKMARDNFVAKQEGQDKQIVRGIWYYGLNEHHSFSRYHATVRANLLVMAWIIANKFPRDYVNADISRFVLRFVRAWVSGLEDTGFIATQNFSVREDFIDKWIDSPFDLMEFTETEHNKIKKLTKRLRDMLPQYLREQAEQAPREIIKMCREGDITPEDLKKYGPSLVLEYILHMAAMGEEHRNETTDYQDILENVMIRRLKREHGMFEDDPRRLVAWKSDMVQALLGAVDKYLPHPKAIRKRTRSPQLREPWLAKDTFFEIMRSGMKAVEEEIEDDLAGAFGDTSLDVKDLDGMELD